jgi:hypothetical protein
MRGESQPSGGDDLDSFSGLWLRRRGQVGSLKRPTAVDAVRGETRNLSFAVRAGGEFRVRSGCLAARGAHPLAHRRTGGEHWVRGGYPAGGESACNRGALGGRWAGDEAVFQRVVPLNVRGNYCTDFSRAGGENFGEEDSRTVQ